MIIKSSQRAGHKELAVHLVKKRDIDGTPQRVTVSGSRGLASNLTSNLAGSDFASNDNVHTALQDMQILSMASKRCQKDLYHISMNPDHPMNEEDWRIVWDLYEAELGLSHLPYIEVTHEKGEHRQPHRHRVYERVDVASGKAVHLNHTRIRNEKVARIAEFTLGHSLTVGKHNRTVIRQFADEGRDDIIEWMQQAHAHDCPRPAANQNHSDVMMEKRTALPTDQVKAELQACFERTNNGRSFQKEIAEKGYVLTRGDRRDFVIVDFRGGIHSPRRRLGVKAKELREKWQDLEREQLAHVEAVLLQRKAQWLEESGVKAESASSDNVAGQGASEAAARTDGGAATGIGRLSILRQQAEALAAEIRAAKNTLESSNAENIKSAHQTNKTEHDEALNHWQRRATEPESEPPKPQPNVAANKGEQSLQQSRGRNQNIKRGDADQITSLRGQAVIAERQRRLLELWQPTQPIQRATGLRSNLRQARAGDALQSLRLPYPRHAALVSKQAAGQNLGEGAEQPSADDGKVLEKALAEYQQLWQQRFKGLGGEQQPALGHKETGAQYRLADRFILQRLAARGYSRQQSRRVLMQASPEVMNQQPGDRLRYVRRLVDKVYSQHEQQVAVVAQQKQVKAACNTQQQREQQGKNQAQSREQGKADTLSPLPSNQKTDSKPKFGEKERQQRQRPKEPEIER